MKLLSLLPQAFGKFHEDTAVRLENGLNLILGDNESGKSTLGALILGMFYGFKKDGKTRISRLPEYDRYRPWSGDDYRGVMTYEEGGRIYRVERSFDPDIVKILDDTTGEDLTRQFTQDSRKEYDFAARHLGLSLKEFRNTVWIGQLGSTQEPGLGNEIQGKLENVLQGGAEEVSLGRALGALANARAEIKAPRSTKAKMDLALLEMERIENELAAARLREEQVREWLAEASDLSQEKDRLQSAVESGTKELRKARYRMLRGVLAASSDLEAEASALRERAASLEWARDLPADCEKSYRDVSGEIEGLERRIAEVKAEAAALLERREKVQSAIESLSPIESTGVDEVAVAALHSKYGLAKAQAMGGQRRTNDARQALRVVENEGKEKGYPSEDLSEDVIRMAEDHQRNCALAEKERDRLEIEAERARAAVSSASSGDSSTLLYAVALVIVGLAVVCTVMGLPYSIPLFIAAVVVFGLGVSRHSRYAKVRAGAREALYEKEEELEAQAERIESVNKTLSEFLYAVGAKSVEELRSISREIVSYQSRLATAKERFEEVQKAWFDASSELATVEKDLLAHLRAAGIVQASDPVTDAAVDRLRKALRDLKVQKDAIKSLDERQGEVAANLRRQEELLSEALERKTSLMRACGVETDGALAEKIAAKAAHDEACRAEQGILARREALLSGKDISEIRREVQELSQDRAVGLDDDVPAGGQTDGVVAEKGAYPSVTDREYEDLRRALDADKAHLYEVGQKLASLERVIRLRGEEGRASQAVTEDLSRQQAIMDELSMEHDSLELAHKTLTELSTSIRREFAPALSQRVGAVLQGITGGKYTEVRVSPDLEMSVISPGTGSQISISELSSGTLDQCYFALRIAIAEAITNKESFPLFLDDSFVQYDDRRLEGALKLLADLSAKHQVLVFSCHDREEELATKMGLKFHRVAL